MKMNKKETDVTTRKTNKKMADLNPTISIFTFNVNGLSI